MDTINKKKKSLSGQSKADLTSLTKSLGWPSFKGDQLHEWLYKKYIDSFDEITNISKKDREELKDKFSFSSLSLHTKEISSDKTIKYLWKLNDGSLVESVRMVMDEGKSYTACISSQVGCAIGCIFCATGKLKLKRNLTAGEIIEQILSIQRDTKERLSNIVFMGQGEPLQNYEEVVKAIKLIRESVGIGARHITLSTSGIPKKIKELTKEQIPCTLALSLHAPDQSTREILVPTAKKNKIHDIMESVYEYYNQTKRRVTIEYVMLDELNDSIEHAKALADLLKDLHCHVNLIPYNPIKVGKDLKLKRPPMGKIYKFKEVLEKTSRKKVTVRHEKGTDINAACGQLSNNIQLSESRKSI